jgi:hypothetical protein
MSQLESVYVVTSTVGNVPQIRLILLKRMTNSPADERFQAIILEAARQ